MNQEIIKATLLEQDETDILRFEIEEAQLDIDLNSSECQNAFKKLFSSILEEAIYSSIEIQLEVQEGYSRGMYVEVCEEYIKDLNRELKEVVKLIQQEISE